MAPLPWWVVTSNCQPKETLSPSLCCLCQGVWFQEQENRTKTSMVVQSKTLHWQNNPAIAESWLRGIPFISCPRAGRMNLQHQNLRSVPATAALLSEVGSSTASSTANGRLSLCWEPLYCHWQTGMELLEFLGYYSPVEFRIVSMTSSCSMQHESPAFISECVYFIHISISCVYVTMEIERKI